jgi:hypothetical protein
MSSSRVSHARVSYRIGGFSFATYSPTALSSVCDSPFVV